MSKVGAGCTFVGVVTFEGEIKVAVVGAMLLLFRRRCHGPERRLHCGKHGGSKKLGRSMF